MDSFLYSVRKITGQSIRDSLYGSHEYRDFCPDFLQLMIGYVLDTAGDVSSAAIVSDTTTPRTIVKRAPSLLDSIGLFIDVLTQNEVPPRLDTTWRPRERLAVSGTIVPGFEITSTNVGAFRSFVDPAHNAITVNFFQVGAEKYVSVDLLFDFFRNFVEGYVDNTPMVWFTNLWNNDYEPPGGYPWYVAPYVACYYTDLSYTEDKFSYEVEVQTWTDTRFGFPLRINSRTRYSGSVTRHRLRPWEISVKFTQGDGVAFTGPFPWIAWGVWQKPIVTGPKAYFRNSVEAPDILSMLSAVPFSIASFAPGLFHTQSQSFLALLGEVSKNFESLVESPQFIPTLTGVADSIISKDSVLGSKLGLFTSPSAFDSFSRESPLSRIRLLLKFLAGLHLAYVFAIAPALKSADDALTTFIREVSVSKGKSYVKYTTQDGTFSGWPAGLVKLVQGFRSEEIARCEVLYGSQAETSLTKTRTFEALDRVLDDVRRAGIEPDPVYLYAAIPLSFVFDAVVFPVAVIMTDAYQRFKMTTSRHFTMGHSVRVVVTYRSGLVYRLYVRSDASQILFDPPDTSWLKASGLTPAIAISLATVLFL